MIGAMRPLADRRNRATGYFVLVLKKHLGQDKNFSMLPATTSWRIRTMSNRRFEMYDYRQIIHRIRMGQTDREIARTKIIGRTKCGQIRAIAQDKGWLAEESPLPDDAALSEVFTNKASSNPTHQSKCHSYEEQIKTWLSDGICLTTIQRALKETFGFSGSYSSVRRMAQNLGYHEKPVTCVLEFEPGQAAQVDFGKGPDIQDVFTGVVTKTWIFVMTLCFSRHTYAEIVPNQKTATWLVCHRRAFEFFGGVPLKMIIDNTKCAITKACYHDPEVQRSYGEMAEGYGFIISPCPPRDPQKKGRVESGVKYVKNSFVPLRTYRSLTDANKQLQQWIMETAGNRIHGTTRQKPLTLFSESEKPFLKSLPDVPVEMAAWCQVKVHGNCHVQFEKAYYSAPHPLAHKKLWLRATDNTVKLYSDLKLVAAHPRLKKPGAYSTVDEHMPPAAIAWKLQDTQWCLKQSEAVGPACYDVIRKLFGDTVLDNLRAVQGIIGLAKKYGSVRLENACVRALHFDNVRYKSVKNILGQGLDQLPLEHELFSPVSLSPVYTSGRFLRDIDNIREARRLPI
jgi:hypothetical protein